MTLNFKTRIALYYLIASATIILLVFFTIFFVVKQTVYKNLDNDLSYEAQTHIKELNKATLEFYDREEWEEREHREVQVNPVFVQIMDSTGKIAAKSPNLKNDDLTYSKTENPNVHYIAFLENEMLRQVQMPIQYQGKNVGVVITAMSLKSSNVVLTKLKNILIPSYPLVLVLLFFISRFLAGRNIQPIVNITETTKRIHKNNLSERVMLPTNKDELFELSTSINHLLQHIEETLIRERQFTSDASHELRTPIAALRGTLEVLIRKNRSQEEYESKICQSLKTVDHMTEIIDQLLFLARFDYGAISTEKTEIITLIDHILTDHYQEIKNKKLQIDFKFNSAEDLQVPEYYATLILENIISNAIKYSYDEQKIKIRVFLENERLKCTIKDHGIGIKKEDIEKIFNPFFRSEALNHKHISGTGLGLSIAKKAAIAINAKISLESEQQKGTCFVITF
ncbi:ATP-binding protein [Zhouia sp. PK063]|uniref:sensor histidine kinase n=1 Tax=Zhouia sp. PK063 TaxID=3373602 RepID=UPI003788BC92